MEIKTQSDGLIYEQCKDLSDRIVLVAEKMFWKVKS